MSYLFTRRVVVNPAHFRAGLAHALSMLKLVNEKTQLDASLFQVLQGEPLGTLAFASRTESYAASVDAADALVQSDEYLDKVEAGAQFYVGNPVDALGEFIHAAGEVDTPPAAANVVSATLEVNRADAAISWATKIPSRLGILVSHAQIRIHLRSP